ncbi:aminoglycoside phosphotransferase family protein [Pseudomonas sp. BGr12]|uniref:aminoglycoside phosphotransferase family protein n=1 Tax=unclassified Pseudomonas TaxID=196821 RepID=UPI00177C6508|nr:MULTISPECIES: aminoglycoside phosphotransferase family protein [unclassified Pseudomonas]MBD9500045.1 3'-kinase [Pseudomonas sp. PDM17]MBD9575261.1 3'-kinase [Pseudomonas sp. PDM23]MBD9669797.1 3'-kinase [Pseudomonas sp. PDM21]MDL2427904.1 3'-kinase [Pseudomonas sp. BJa5]
MPLPTPVPVDFQRVLQLWQLVPEGEPIITPSSHLLPVRWMGRAAMIKRALDVDEQGGGLVMNWWCGEGAAQVFAYDGDTILMERAEGSRSLMHMALHGEDDQASRIVCDTVRRLHWPRDTPAPELLDLRQWFRDLAPAATRYGGLFPRCLETAEALLASEHDRRVLHGDVHHDNVLDFGERGWLAIDPKRLFGERLFDYANLLCNPDLPTSRERTRFLRQLDVIVEHARVDRRRLLEWVLAFAGLSAAWFLDDGMAADSDLSVAHLAAAELDRMACCA